MKKVSKTWHGIRLFLTRIVFPIMILFAIGATIAVQLDKRAYKNAPTSDFLKYTSFSVTGAYEGEDVNFTVCREFKERYRYNGDLRVFIVSDRTDQKPVPVYSRPIQSTLNSDGCEPKRIRDIDFHHVAGSYRMSSRVCINVKYGYEKCTDDVLSNVYRIRTRPEQAQALIDYYQNLIEQLREDGTDPGSLSPSNSSSSTTNAPNQQSSVTNNTTNNTTTNPSTNTTQVQTCQPTRYLACLN